MGDAYDKNYRPKGQRTRQITNLAGPFGAEVTSSHSDPSGAGGKPIGLNQGYTTDNQRFLHILFRAKGDSDPRTLTVWGYNHAFAQWAPLTASNNNPVTMTSNGNNYEIFEIAGCDKIYFQVDAALHVDDDLKAGCSSF